jgi:hypothetical protein
MAAAAVCRGEWFGAAEGLPFDRMFVAGEPTGIYQDSKLRGRPKQCQGHKHQPHRSPAPALKRAEVRRVRIVFPPAALLRQAARGSPAGAETSRRGQSRRPL